jgi:hypothetical protein
MSSADKNTPNNGVAALLLGEQEPTAASSTPLAKKFYISRGRSLKALAILSLGLLNEDGDPIFDVKALPWSSAEKVSNIKPTASDMKEEVERRASVAGIDPMPRPKAWTLQRLTDWLTAHPLVRKDDVSFVLSTVAARSAAAENAAREKEDEERALDGGCTSWHGKFPMLRLIHALVNHDDIKSAYLTRHDLPSGRMAIENRNTVEAHMGTVWQMMADRWNDPNFLPVTGIFPELHSDFSRPIALNHYYVSQMQVATAEKVEEKWNTMNLRLKRVIDGWEAIGQGDGDRKAFATACITTTEPSNRSTGARTCFEEMAILDDC